MLSLNKPIIIKNWITIHLAYSLMALLLIEEICPTLSGANYATILSNNI